ncbi:transcriptional regulator [Planotetraspora silvatica]|uniref:Transcriptional regulator n=1 Tax=Planotetraspora silvatica TaxID=234614 RepID=A0A8J3UKM3_9ACTN|nr:helix-turn-helix transcriptional regulator [Planotetraspora silvatica]GII46988.1 transcriptional regulator [Planotetraspora silvatica]
MLYGRDRETAELDRLIDAALRGRGDACVLWGDPGIGKTALLRYIEGRAEGLAVLRSRGTRSESAMAFAALHELLWPVLDRVDALPAPQAAALRAAFGLGEGRTDSLLLGAATLTLLSELARRRPVLILVDDAQWIDTESASCLAFVARRLRTEPITLVAAHQGDPADGRWSGVQGLHVEPLDEAAAHEYLRAEHAELTEPAAKAVLRSAHGNPLALHEFSGMADVDPAEGDTLSPGPRLRQAFLATVASLPRAARTLLLLVAAEDRGDLGTVNTAATALGIGAETWDQAVVGRFLDLTGTRVSLRHPLIRSVIYEAALLPERQAVHRALAAALGGQDDTDRRAWHLAEATLESDAEVADLLHHSAQRALARGGCAAASRALRRSAELTPDAVQAGGRYAVAARAAWESGEPERARELLAQARSRAPEAVVTTLSGGLRGLLEFVHGEQARAHRLLLAEALIVEDPRLAVQLACLALRAAWNIDSPEHWARALGVLDGLPATGDERIDLLVTGFRHWWFEEALPDRQAMPEITPGNDLDLLIWLMVPAPIALAWGLEEQARACYQGAADRLKETGVLSGLALLLSQVGLVDMMAGHWPEARINVSEGLRLAEDMGACSVIAQCLNVMGWLRAATEGETAADEMVQEVRRHRSNWSSRALMGASYWHQGVAALGAGRAEDASDLLDRLITPGGQAAHSTFAVLAAADAVEAAVRAGRPDGASEWVRLIEEWADRSGAAWAKGAAFRCRALTAERAEAEDLYPLALAGYAEADRPFDHARTELLYGEWLRRARRRAQARGHLRAARETFARLGAHDWLARATTELELAGEAGIQAEQATGPTELTPQETRIAGLAAQGRTNKEIAASLFISPRTVGHHLSSVFLKLGITSRTELRELAETLSE